MNPAKIINELNKLGVSYKLQNITEIQIEFVVPNFVWASVIKLNTETLEVEEIHGLGWHRRTIQLTKETLLEYLIQNVKPFNRLGAIKYDPI